MPHAADRGRSGLVVAVLALCGTVVSLQQTAVVPLLPDLPRLLHTAPDNASWLVTTTLVAGAVAIPVLSRLADMFGKKRMILVAVGFMVAGSALGAVSTSLPPLIVARALQGVGIALIPIGIAIMRDELPRDRLPLGVAVLSATLALGAGLGLPLVGLIAETMEWRSIFWMAGLLGAAMLVIVIRVVPESPVRSPGSFDYAGALLLCAAVTAVLLGISKGAHWGWLSWPTLALLLTGVGLLVVWVPVELRMASPLVDIRVAARPAVLLVNVASVLCGFAMYVNLLVTTQLLQLPTSTGYGLGLDILHAGLWLAPTALVFGSMAPASAYLIRRIGPLTALLAGSLVMAAAYAARAFATHRLWQIVLGEMLVAVGVSMTFAAMPNLITRAVPATETASANGLNTLLRSVGTSMSSATVAAIATATAMHVGGLTYPRFGAHIAAFWLAGAAAALSAVLGVVLLRMRAPDDEPMVAAEPALVAARPATDDQ